MPKFVLTLRFDLATHFNFVNFYGWIMRLFTLTFGNNSLPTLVFLFIILVCLGSCHSLGAHNIK